MKYIIIALLISASFISKGQGLKLDSMVGGHLKIDSLTKIDFTPYYRQEQTGQDTTMEILLVSDSTGRVWQMNGYHVQKVLCCIDGNTSEFGIYRPVSYHEHLFYLNDKKKPLDKSIFVWLSRKPN